MAEVKWIKIVTDVFDNRKIKLIRKMPEGAEIVVTWFQLLCLAGETNDNGLIYVTKTVPYTEETLSSAFDTPISIIRLALDTFQRLEMINIYNSFLCVSNWEKYQNTDGLTKIREQTRARVANHRAKQKEISTKCNVTVTLPVTHCNATEEELDIEREVDIEIDIPPIVPQGTESSFQVFWTAYPKKRSKGQAEKAWNKIKPNEQLQNRILTSLEQAKTSVDWTKSGGQFIPYPSTWLNAKGWEDDLAEQPKRLPKGFESIKRYVDGGQP